MRRRQIIFQIRIWCSDDSCSEFWFDKELSNYYANPLDAKKELSKYEGKSKSELERICEVMDVGSNKPRIVELMLILD